MNYQKILKKAIDLHVHIGPEIIPRRFNLCELIDYEKGKLKGMGVKNHFFPTVKLDKGYAGNSNPFIIHSVVLNNYVGGFNADIIYAVARLSDRRIIVWFPTLHAKNFLRDEKFEIPKEWISRKSKTKIGLCPASKVKALSVFDSRGLIAKEVKDVLLAIKECDAILATGHLSWQETRELVRFATEKIGIKKIVITHPIYPKINMPLKVQKELAKMGATIEHCYSMYSIDKIPIERIAAQIKEVGAKNCLLSSDVGQKFSKSPSEALSDFVSLLGKKGITKQEIKIMLVDNPSKIVA